MKSSPGSVFFCSSSVSLVLWFLWFSGFSGSCGSRGSLVLVVLWCLWFSSSSDSCGWRGKKKFVPFRILKKGFLLFRSHLTRSFHKSVIEWFDIFARGHGTTRELFSQCTRIDECFDWQNNT